MLAKVVKRATACKEINYSRDTINIRDDSSSRVNSNIMDANSSKATTAGALLTSWMPTAARPPETDSREVNQKHTAGMPAKAEMLAKAVKPATACKEINYSRDTVNIRDGSSRGSSNIMDANSSKAASNIQQGCQQEHQELATRTLATSTETKGTSQTSKAEGRPATAGMPEIIERPTTALLSAGTPNN
jgi:hypothetical protein